MLQKHNNEIDHMDATKVCNLQDISLRAPEIKISLPRSEAVITVTEDCYLMGCDIPPP
jgi:hypothetical protein